MSDQIINAIDLLDDWINKNNKNNWIGYDPFDGLSAPFARKFTFEIPILRIALQQSVRRFPINLRPLLGITRKPNNQAMGYFASGYLRLYEITEQSEYLEKAVFCLSELEKNTSRGYTGKAWGWFFDYQSRGHFLHQGEPTVVWTSFISHSFLDAFELLSEQKYLKVARSACNFILSDLPRHNYDDKSLCISYVTNRLLEIHNANMLAAFLLARVFRHTQEPELFEIASMAVRYTMNHQKEDGSWFYGEGLRWHWVDGYHTGFVLDALYGYIQSTGDYQYEKNLIKGMDYYRAYLFDGVLAKFSSNATYPIDIQAVAQAIQTFSLIPEKYHGDISWSEQVAKWAIQEMQDPDGFFYFRKHRHMVNKTPLLHWGQATMLAALSLLLQRRQTLPLKTEPTEFEKAKIP